MPLAPTLPQELIDKIIRNFAGQPEARDTVKSCSVVSSSFRNPAQKLIFESIAFSLDEPQHTRNAALNQVLTSNLCLCRYVEVLTLTVRKRSFDISFLPLPKFPRLRLVNLSSDPASVQWDNVPVCLKRIVYSILQSPALRVLHIFYIEKLPVNALHLCHHLNSLLIWTGTITADNEPDDVLPPSPFTDSGSREYLQSLNFGDTVIGTGLRPAFLDPSSPTSISRLRRLVMDLCNEFSLSECRVLLELPPTYLEELELFLLEFSRTLLANFRPIADLGNLPNLRRLQVHPKGLHSFIYVYRLLQCASSIEHLTEISLSIEKEAYNAGNSDILGVWSCLDGLLAGSRVTVRIVVVTFGEGYFGEGNYPSERIRKFFKDATPLLFKSGRLAVQKDTDPNLIISPDV